MLYNILCKELLNELDQPKHLIKVRFREKEIKQEKFQKRPYEELILENVYIRGMRFLITCAFARKLQR